MVMAILIKNKLLLLSMLHLIPWLVGLAKKEQVKQKLVRLSRKVILIKMAKFVKINYWNYSKGLLNVDAIMEERNDFLYQFFMIVWEVL